MSIDSVSSLVFASTAARTHGSCSLNIVWVNSPWCWLMDMVIVMISTNFLGRGTREEVLNGPGFGDCHSKSKWSPIIRVMELLNVSSILERAIGIESTWIARCSHVETVRQNLTRMLNSFIP